MYSFLSKAKKCLDDAKNRSLTIEQRREMSIELASDMLHEALKTERYSEKSRQATLAKMMNDSHGKAFVTSLADQAFRSSDRLRIADQILYLIDKFGVPKFLPWHRRVQMYVFKVFGKRASALLVPLFLKIIRKEASLVIIPGEPFSLLKYLKARRKSGVKVNLNRIGEAILGEEEAKRRLDSYLKDLATPEIECISIKVSTLFSQINLVAWEETLSVLRDRLKMLYRAAQENDYKTLSGKRVQKFVYLDMEEYRDLHLTIQLFCMTLDDPDFLKLSAGIVLQSYLPETYFLQKEITSWAMARVANGGAPIKIRIVKGANMAMEQVDASLHGWKPATYLKKLETDANYKRMVLYGCEPERAKAVFLGIASHNLFDIAFAMLLRKEKNVEKYVGFEMLEGMADPLRRVVQTLTDDMLLYCPAAKKDDFQSAIAYLTRRLDENTAPENFLKVAFSMIPGTFDWQNQANLFSSACHDAGHVSSTEMRLQNRFENPIGLPFNAPFKNEPDTDFSLMQNVKWAGQLARRWKSMEIEAIPLVIGNEIVTDGVEWESGRDPSFPSFAKYRYAIGGEAEAEIALKTAVVAHRSWSTLAQNIRLILIDKVAERLMAKRADLIGAMMIDTAKPVNEGDSEVSEAIDFVAYYRRSIEELSSIEDVAFSSKGVVLVAPPWNFSCSIPVGGIVAALSAGNSVIFKPAPEAVLVGWHVANAFWEAGIGRDVLQFFCCHDEPTASQLIQDPRIASVILTGATKTAQRILSLKPGIDLLAETGGKNAMIITRLADRDLAIKNLIDSAFLYSGQKCSACSLAILEREVYEDPIFMRQLRDAASSMRVDVASELSAKVIPLIRSPSPELSKALTTLEDGEEWLLEPWQDRGNPNLWSPGIKLGVKQASVTHQTEFFGPVLGVMCAADLEEAIKLANDTPYGLTAGIQTLDEREQKTWVEKIMAGNCYINRTMTGAIVQRHPFGGCKASSYGPGAKAGGPNYVLQLMRKTQVFPPLEKEPLGAAAQSLNQYVQRNLQKNLLDAHERELWSKALGSYAFFWNHYFSKDQQPQHLLGETDTLKYIPRNDIVLRVTKGDIPVDILRVVAAALTCKAHLSISCSEKRDDLFNSAWLKIASFIDVTEESEKTFIERLESGSIKRIRMVSMPEDCIKNAAAKKLCYIASDPVLCNGRIELLHYLREVLVSTSYHRYGYLGT